MVVKQLSSNEVEAVSVDALGLAQTDAGLFSTEALAASLRRAASVLCPTTPGQLVRSVLEALAGLPGSTEDLRGELDTLLQSLLSYGDLLELPTETPDGTVRRIYLGPPSFVKRSSGSCLMLGIRPDAAPLLGDELSQHIDYEGHVRIMRPAGPVEELVAAGGLTELAPDQWLRAPRPASPSEVIDEHVRRLHAAGPSGEIANLRFIDPTSPVTYYRGRWRTPTKKDNGTVVARRPQAFGADLWCFADLSGGEVRRLLDFPLTLSLTPAADEAWRVQAALDALAGHPQQIRVRASHEPDRVVVDLLSPLPSWAQRRLDVIGTPILRSHGALFSYSLPAEEVEEEVRFLNEMLWLSVGEPREGNRFEN